jgi:hypothetical protein
MSSRDTTSTGLALAPRVLSAGRGYLTFPGMVTSPASGFAQFTLGAGLAFRLTGAMVR